MVSKKGFTLIEVVVVMAIIAVLAVLVVGAIQVARKQSKYTEARSELRDIRTAMEAYISKTGELPPTGGSCYSLQQLPNSYSTGQWNMAVDAIKAEGIINDDTATEYKTDPWGRPYMYRDQWGIAGVSENWLCTRGEKEGRGAGPNYWPPGSEDEECDNIPN